MPSPRSASAIFHRLSPFATTWNCGWRRAQVLSRSSWRRSFLAETFEEFKNRSELAFFQSKLAENGGNVKRTAERLGMQRSHMYKKLDRYGLK